jgi:methionyl-tRNA formyltransferase
MTRYRTIFFGTPDFSVPILRALADETDLVLVVSQPDRPVGRGCRMCKPPVKQAAEALGIPVIQPNVVKGKRFAARMAELKPDFIVTAAFGRILGKSLLKVPNKLALNVHASLLPRHRGAAPANWAIIEGDKETGVSIMEMVPELDAGPVYLTHRTPIDTTETASELLERLSSIGAEALIVCIATFDSLSPIPQNSDEATYARMLKKEDGQIDWSKRATEISNHVRGMSPWPSAVTCIDGAPYKIHKAHPLDEAGGDAEEKQAPGTVVSVCAHGLDVACGKGVLRIVEIQAPGRKRMPVQAFILGTSLAIGMRFGPPNP